MNTVFVVVVVDDNYSVTAVMLMLNLDLKKKMIRIFQYKHFYESFKSKTIINNFVLAVVKPKLY